MSLNHTKHTNVLMRQGNRFKAYKFSKWNLIIRTSWTFDLSRTERKINTLNYNLPQFIYIVLLSDSVNMTSGPGFSSSVVGHCGWLTCSPGPHCCPGPSCPAAGRIPPYSASQPPGRLWVVDSGSFDWPASCGSVRWWTGAACVEAGLAGEEVGPVD